MFGFYDAQIKYVEQYNLVRNQEKNRGKKIKKVVLALIEDRSVFLEDR